MVGKSITRLAAALAVVTLVAACESSEERAEGHYQSAVELLAEGDVDRAIVELRNVFQLNPQHIDARRTIARLMREQNRIENAYREYLRLVEQSPDDLEGRVALAEMAIDLQNWPEARRHGERAIAIAPGDPAVRVIDVNLRYARAIEGDDAAAQRDVVRDAQVLLAELPDNLMLLRVLYDGAARDNRPEEALQRLENALAIAPDDLRLLRARLQLLAMLERFDQVEGQLRAMIDRFPEEQALPGVLLRYYVDRGENAKAESFLRDLIANSEDERRTDAKAALVQFLAQTQGREAALAELDAMIGSGEAAEMFRAARAGMIFDMGDREGAIAEMQAIIDASEPSDATRSVKLALARMLMATGNAVGARRLVEEIIEEDRTHVDALKMKAAWLIDDGATDEGIALLRTVLDESPEDADAMTLTARAHARNGNRDLARDFLALAYEASRAAPGETLRYARALREDGRLMTAEEILIAALRLAPGNLDLLIELGGVYVALEDWPRGEQVERTIRRLDNAEARRAADGMRAARLSAQGRTDEAIEFLEQLAVEGGDNRVMAQIAVVRARLAGGEPDVALEYARDAAAGDPGNIALKLTLGTALFVNRLFPEAEAVYREVVAASPTTERGWLELIRVRNAQGDAEGARRALEEALVALPEGVNLLWAQATYAERAGDIDGAIAIYETLLDRAPNSDIVANNLASLLSTYRSDAESLARAEALARRFRETTVPAFQDTYGWIAYQRGQYAEAVEYLEAAAAALGDEPLVRYHLGMAHLGTGNSEAALEQLRLAVELAGPEDPRAQFAQAREEIARLESGAATGGASESK